MNNRPGSPLGRKTAAPLRRGPWALVLLLLALFLGQAAPARSQDLGFVTDWREAALSGLNGVSLAVVEKEEGGYLSYRMDGPHGMAAASSADGLNWTAEPGFAPPLAQAGEFASNPWVFRLEDGRFRMVYEIQNQDGNRRLYSALSDDGLVFENEGLVMAGDGEDLGPSGTAVFLSVPTGYRLPDGTLRMFFVSQGDRIRSALSRDEGLTWTKDEGVRMRSAVDPCLLPLEDGGLRLLYVDWSPLYRVRRILYADSADGLNFTHQGPVVTSNSLTGETMMVDPELVGLADGGLRLYFSFGRGMEIPIYTALPPRDWPLWTYPLNRPD